MMSRENDNAARFLSVVVVAVVVVASNSVGYVDCASETPDEAVMNNPAALDLFSKAVFSKFSNFTSLFSKEIIQNLGYCIKDV